MLVARSLPPNNLVRLRTSVVVKRESNVPDTVWRGVPPSSAQWQTVAVPNPASANAEAKAIPWRKGEPEVDPLYLFACQVEWEQRGDPSAAWEVVAGSRDPNHNVRAQSLALLERLSQPRSQSPKIEVEQRHAFAKEESMKAPYGLDVIESCMGCKASRESFFCRLSPKVLRSLDAASYHSVMPAGALLFVEGQSPRGVYVLCSGKVKLSTTSREGKVLILKQAEAGEVLGLSAAISGTSYEMSAETCTPCQLDFIGRLDLMNLLQNESEVGVHAAQSLSREFQSAYRDIHDLVLARSSSGKLARLLLSCASAGSAESQEHRVRSAMTHEEMAQRIGSSRETVTRLLSSLKKKKLIRLEGATLVIRDRSGLEALAI